jgi:hypothetical protein
MNAWPWRTHQPSPPPRRRPVVQWLVLPMLVALAALVTFSPALDAEFVNWDDDKTIVDNPRIRGFDWSWAFTQSKMGHYHPLTWLSYSVDHAIGQARYEGCRPKPKSATGPISTRASFT